MALVSDHIFDEEAWLKPKYDIKLLSKDDIWGKTVKLKVV